MNIRHWHWYFLAIGLAAFGATPGRAQPLFTQDAIRPPGAIPQANAPARNLRPADDVTGSIPPQAQQRAMPARTDEDTSQAMRRQLVTYAGSEAPGTIVVDTDNTMLYFVLGRGQAIRYGVGVGRDGFRWSGQQAITRMAAWPDWHPPTEMIERQPYLPRFMAGGPSNPMGARALYLGNSVYRIHGTNDPKTIGQFISSGCIRLINEDIEDLYARVNVGTTVIVMPSARGYVS